MPQKRFKPEQIIWKLREAEVLVSQGATVDEVCRKLAEFAEKGLLKEVALPTEEEEADRQVLRLRDHPNLSSSWVVPYAFQGIARTST